MDRVASEHGIRVLFIKGPVLNVQQLRVPRDSLDVDVLVDPTRFDELLAGLRAVGWYPYIEVPTELHSAPEHSATLKHDAWPCSLDLHHYFPGCLAPAQQVFDELWARRSSVELLGRELPCTDVAGSAVIAALNALRSPDSIREKSELAHLTGVLDQDLSRADRADLAGLAERMGAAEIVSPLLEALGIHPATATPDHADGLAAWHLLTVAGTYPTVLWLEELRQTPWQRRPAVFWRAALLTEEAIRNYTPDLPAGRRGLALGRLQRLRRVLPQIPKAAIYLAKSRGLR